MAIPIIDSAKRIEQQFRTGEEPVLVMCSDVNLLNTPDIALVRIKSSHWAGINQSHSLSAPSIGSRWLDGVVDITPSTYAKVPVTIDTHLFRHLAQGQEKTTIQAIADSLKEQNEACFDSALARKGRMKSNVPQNVVKEKLLQLLDEHWTAEVWDNFMECLNDNTR